MFRGTAEASFFLSASVQPSRYVGGRKRYGSSGFGPVEWLTYFHLDTVNKDDFSIFVPEMNRVVPRIARTRASKDFIIGHVMSSEGL
jgi:hypothetical protein